MDITKKLSIWLITGLLVGLAPILHAEKFHYLPELDLVELSPQMRPEPLAATRYVVKTEQLAMFLENILLFDSIDDYQSLPYILSFQELRNIGGTGDTAYTMGINLKKEIAEYSLLAPGQVLTHPATGEELGMQAYVIGQAVVQKFEKPQTVLIKSATAEIEINTRLVPVVGIDLPAIIEAKFPKKIMNGYVLAVNKDNLGGGGYDSVVISLGKRDGLVQGHILDLVEAKIEKLDTNTYDNVKLPKTKIGEIMVYKPGDKISLAIITYSDRMIVPNDRIEVTAVDF